MYLVGLRVLAVLVVLCAGAALCRGDSSADALAAFKRKDYTTAIRLWQPLAEEGDPQAQVGLGTIYLQGLGVPRDTDKGLTWLQLVAEGGDPRGPWLLGFAYEAGSGVPKDMVKAYQWFDIARSLSHTRAAVGTSRLFLGHMSGELTTEQIESAKALADEWRASHPDLVTPQ